MWFLNTHQQQLCLQQGQIVGQKPRERRQGADTCLCLCPLDLMFSWLYLKHRDYLLYQLTVNLLYQKHRDYRCQHLKSSNMGTSTPYSLGYRKFCMVEFGQTHQHSYTPTLLPKLSQGAKTHEQGMSQQEQGFIYILRGQKDKGPLRQ